MNKKSSLYSRAVILFICLFVIAFIALSICIFTLKNNTIAIVLMVLLICVLFSFISLLLIPGIKSKKAYSDFLYKDKRDALLRAHPFVDESDAVHKSVVKIMEHRAEIESYSKEAEYIALQNQINPHFLYNTLEAIRSDAVWAGLDNIADTVKALATFFRYTISATGNLFSIADELDNVKNYFSIQQYRFGDRIQMAIDFDAPREEVLSYTLPKLTLQPLVENAIRHGLEPKSQPGLVKISFTVTDSRLQISVIDNGVGMDSKTVDRLNDSLAVKDFTPRKSGSGHQSIALKNVNTRIKLLFGEEYGMHIFSQINIGTDIRITVPLVKKD